MWRVWGYEWSWGRGGWVEGCWIEIVELLNCHYCCLGCLVRFVIMGIMLDFVSCVTLHF